MNSEQELRRELAESPTSGRIDVSRVITRSRARRATVQIGGAVVGVLALTGVGVLAVQIPAVGPSATDQAFIAEESADQSGGAADSGLSESKRLPADLLNPCGAVALEPVPSASGLELTVDFPRVADAGADRIDGMVRLTNTSTERVTGSTPAVPAITVTEAGVTVWHSNGPTILSLALIDLAPGESLEYPASFVPVRCSAGDDSGEAFPPGLPALEPGRYEIAAAIDFTPQEPVAGATAEADLVMGPRAPIELE